MLAILLHEVNLKYLHLIYNKMCKKCRIPSNKIFLYWSFFLESIYIRLIVYLDLKQKNANPIKKIVRFNIGYHNVRCNITIPSKNISYQRSNTLWAWIWNPLCFMIMKVALLSPSPLEQQKVSHSNVWSFPGINQWGTFRVAN